MRNSNLLEPEENDSERLNEENLLIESENTFEDTPEKNEGFINFSKVIKYRDLIYSNESKDMNEKLFMKKENVLNHINYIKSVKRQLEEIFEITILEVENKKNTIFTKLNLWFDNILSEVRVKVHEKQKFLEKELQKLFDLITDIDNISSRKYINNKSASLIKSESILAEDIEKITFFHLDLHGDWFKIPLPDLDLLKKIDNLKNPSLFKSTFTQTIVFPESQSKKNCFHNRSSSNSIYFQKKIEILGLFSDHLHKNEKNDNEKIFRIYVPSGKPIYSNFYSVKIRQESTVKEILEELSEYSGKNWEFLAYKKKNKESNVIYYNNEDFFEECLCENRKIFTGCF